MAKLTDTQLVILTSAAQRDDGAVLPLAKSLETKGAAVTKTLAACAERACSKSIRPCRASPPGGKRRTAGA